MYTHKKDFFELLVIATCPGMARLWQYGMVWYGYGKAVFQYATVVLIFKSLGSPQSKLK